jgi:hypothetical protein
MEYDIGGTMSSYWLDPNRVLWCSDYTGTSTFEIIEEDDSRYDPKLLFLNYEMKPTGKRGKFKVHKITKYIKIYPSNWTGEWSSWPTLKLHFRNGELQDYEDITGK